MNYAARTLNGINKLQKGKLWKNDGQIDEFNLSNQIVA